MRTVKFPPGTHGSTRRCVTAVLYALKSTGSRVWDGDHVTRELVDYIHENLDVGVVEIDQIGYALRWLENNGYGIRTLNESRRRHTSFTLMSDVDLNTVPRLTAWDQYTISHARDQNAIVLDDDDEDVIVPKQPPLPFTRSTPSDPYRLQELTDALSRWADVDADAYVDWVDQVLDQLQGAVTHG